LSKIDSHKIHTKGKIFSLIDIL